MQVTSQYSWTRFCWAATVPDVTACTWGSDARGLVHESDYANDGAIEPAMPLRPPLRIMKRGIESMASSTARRLAVVVPAWLILLAAAVLWWDAVAHEEWSVRSVSLAAAATLAGVMFLWIGTRRRARTPSR